MAIRWAPPHGPIVRTCDQIWMAGSVGGRVYVSWLGGTMKLGLSVTIGSPRLPIYILSMYVYVCM
jgi:hypothetical protein